MILKIGTRGSQLALAQSRWVKTRIEEQHPHVHVELAVIKTKGDKILDSPLNLIGGKGLFVKEIEDALLNHHVDLAVHSMKDLPSTLPEGLMLAAFPEREIPYDALISIGNERLTQLPAGARVGTGSLRRKSQILHLRPDLDIVSLRGNVGTRLKKLESEGLQAVVLAAAGLKRLGFENRITTILGDADVLPAVGQGALGLEVRSDDDRTIGLVETLNHGPTEIAVKAERAFLEELQGGCQVPIAGFALSSGEELRLQGMVADLEGDRLIRDEIRGSTREAEEIGVKLARKMLDSGANEILKEFYFG
ncbi:MAG: hydroxymethylbilane synthase [Desulfatiglans sp.]|jgi:hydroxymethylbilane synthase|nr:hydroxymethylbilane synthase [Thermodesulfobacteriota bacterium]MEE4351412.1 hydroxymethylbilane synthase [Desulfatiglans sp.]